MVREPCLTPNGDAIYTNNDLHKFAIHPLSGSTCKKCMDKYKERWASEMMCNNTG